MIRISWWCCFLSSITSWCHVIWLSCHRRWIERSPTSWIESVSKRHGTDASPCVSFLIEIDFWGKDLHLFHRKIVCRFEGLYSFLFVFFFCDYFVRVFFFCAFFSRKACRFKLFTLQQPTQVIATCSLSEFGPKIWIFLVRTTKDYFLCNKSVFPLY